MLGSFFDLAGTLRIDARVVEVETGKIVRSVGVNGPAADFWGLERDLAAKLADTMRTALPAAFEHAALLPPKPRPPKMAAGTAVTYGRALAAADAGKKAEARALLGEGRRGGPGLHAREAGPEHAAHALALRSRIRSPRPAKRGEG